MHISRIEVSRVSIPFETGGPLHGMRPGLKARPWDRMEALMVRVETDDGTVGWGEAFGHFVNAGTYAILTSLVAPWFIGKEPDAIAALMEQAQQTFHSFGRNGPVLYALSAIDIALWDIAAKRSGQPVYRMLGGTGGELQLYASLMKYGEVDAIRRNVQRAYQAGFRMIKLHEATIPDFLAARASVGADTRIMLDVNCPWSVTEARDVVRVIRDHQFHWLEEPVWPPDDFAGLAAVRQEGVPISAGENVGSLHEFRSLFEQRAVDVVQPSVTKVGGISGMRSVLALAQAYSVRVVPHCFYFGPGFLATAHIIAAMPKRPELEIAFIDFQRRPHPAYDPSRPTLRLSDAPGLGFDPDPALFRDYLVQRDELT
jgi:L-alanine-DL-glutamate epimerase-like enolase superfamily enzyme